MKTMRILFYSAFLLSVGSCIPQGSPPAVRPPDYEEKEPAIIAPTVPELFESKSEALTMSDPGNVIPLPSAQYTVSKESADEHRSGPQPPPPESHEMSVEEQVQPSSHVKESAETAKPVRHRKLRCPTLDPWKNSEPHPDTDQSCQQGFPGWQKEASCNCDFLPGDRDSSGCVTKFRTLCSRDEEDDVGEPQQIQPPVTSESLFPENNAASQGTRGSVDYPQPPSGGADYNQQRVPSSREEYRRLL